MFSALGPVSGQKEMPAYFNCAVDVHNMNTILAGAPVGTRFLCFETLKSPLCHPWQDIHNCGPATAEKVGGSRFFFTFCDGLPRGGGWRKGRFALMGGHGPLHGELFRVKDFGTFRCKRAKVGGGIALWLSWAHFRPSCRQQCTAA